MNANQARFNEDLTSYTTDPSKYSPVQMQIFKHYQETGEYLGGVPVDGDIMEHTATTYGTVFTDETIYQTAVATGGMVTQDKTTVRENLYDKATVAYSGMNPYYKRGNEIEYQFLTDEEKKALQDEFGDKELNHKDLVKSAENVIKGDQFKVLKQNSELVAFMVNYKR